MKQCIGLIKRHQGGFSLLEVMIALLIFSVLIITAVNVVKSQREYSHLLENQHYMNQVKKGFITFVKVNRFLPCPDTDGDGKENREGAPNFECTLARGQVPFLDLGVPARDAWNQPLFYAVNTRADSSGLLDIADPVASASYFNNQAAPVFGLNTLPMSVPVTGDPTVGGGAGNYRICSETTNTTTGCNATTPNGQLLEAFAIAVVVSFGENGARTWGAIHSGINGNTIGLDLAEVENMDGDQNYWQAVGSQRTGQRFDDQLFWLLGSDIKYAVISSGGILD